MKTQEVVSRTLRSVDHDPFLDPPEAVRTVESSAMVRLKPVDFDPFSQTEAGSVLPSTDSQRDLWFSSQLGDDAHCAHLQLCSLRFSGPLREDLLAEALRRLVGRHEALRSTFWACGTRVFVAPSMPVGMSVIDLTSRLPADRQAELERLEVHEASTPFDLTHGPLLRATLLRTAPDEHVMLFTLHQLVADDWSMGVLLDELGALYSSAARGDEPALPPPDSFATDPGRVVADPGRQECGATLAYWRSVFETLPAPLMLPTDRPRPGCRTYAGRSGERRLDRSLVDGLRQLGSRHGCTQAGTFLAAFLVFLHRLTGQSDLVVGMPSAAQAMTGRTRLVGQCANLLPLRHDVHGGSSFTALLDALRPQLLDAFDNTQVTLGRVVELLRPPHDPSRPPLTSVLLNHVEHGGEIAFEGLACTCSTRPPRFVGFEWRLDVETVPEGADLRLTCNADLFDAATIERRLEEFETLVRAFVAAPAAPLNSLPVLGAGERALIDRFSGIEPTARDPIASDSLVHERVATQAAGRPDAPAMIFDGRVTSYAELDACANRVAHHLVEQGVGPGQLAAVCVERSPRMVVAMLGVLRAGGAFIPVEPGEPPERFGFILEDSEAGLLLTEDLVRASLPRHGARTLLLDALDLQDVETSGPPEVLIAGGDLACMAYTPGPTGKLVGVEVTHEALANVLAAMQREPGISAADVLVAVAPVANESAIVELFLPLISGATLVPAGRVMEADGRSLMVLLARTEATIMQASPATWKRMIGAGWAGDTGLRALSGSPLDPELVADLRPRCKELWHLYGHAEATVWSTVACLEVGEPVTIGHPIANTQVHVLDANGQRVPIGVTGELCIGGVGVARGYRHRPGLTAARFVRDHYSAASDARIFRTGDLGRYRGDGRLEWLGPLEQSVKPRVASGEPPPGDQERRPLDPRDDLELRLQCMWRRALGVPRIGIQDDFFDLGGHSLLAMSVLAEIKESLGVSLEVPQFLAGRTIERLAELLRDGQSPVTSDHLLLLREPSGVPARPPVFFICGSALYRQLARQLHPDHPVYAVFLEPDEASVVPGEPLGPSVQSMAAAYLKLVRRAHPEGPFHLVGASFGGVLAFEMAQQLSAAGEGVGLVALLDAPGVGDQRPSLVKRAIFHARQVRQLGPEYVTRRLRAGARGEAPATLPDPVRSRKDSPRALRRRAMRQRVYLDALRRYRPQQYAGCLELFLATQRSAADALLGDPIVAWHAVAPGRLTVHRMPGSPEEMLGAPHVEQLGVTVQASLEAALEPRAVGR